MLEILKDFIHREKSQIQEFDDSITINLLSTDLKKILPLIKEHKYHFISWVLCHKEADVYLSKFFFHSKKINKLIVIETEYSGHGIESLSSLLPVFQQYESKFSKKYPLLKFHDQIHKPINWDHPLEFNRDINETEVTIVPVGPVHAGVIEPGFFKFSCIGEHILNLDIKLGYMHREIEKIIVGKNLEQAISISENICGDSSVAYSLALIQAIEKILAINPNQQALLTRTIVLELERIYNHAGDLAALINDTGFAFAYSRLSLIKEKILRLNEKFFGHRFLKSFLTLGSVKAIPSKEQLDEIKTTLQKLQGDFRHYINLIENNSGVIERFKRTGILSYRTAQELSVTGLVARASGISFDSRRDLAFAAYPILKMQVHGNKTGDVLARYKLRVSELLESILIIEQCINKMWDEESKQNFNSLPNSSHDQRSAFSLAESARGDVFVYLELGSDKKILDCQFRDPSFHNWKSLENAVLGNILADFPLCNKSFNLAYAGNDL